MSCGVRLRRKSVMSTLQAQLLKQGVLTCGVQSCMLRKLASPLLGAILQVAAAAEAAAVAAADAAEAAAAATGCNSAQGSLPHCAAADGTALVPIGPPMRPYEGFETLQAELAALRAAAAPSARREAALLGFLAALLGLMAAGLLKGQARRPRVRAAVVALAAANGLVGLALHARAWLPGLCAGSGLGAWLPSGCASGGGGNTVAGPFSPGLPQCFVTG